MDLVGMGALWKIVLPICNVGIFFQQNAFVYFCVDSLEKHYKLCRASQNQQVLIEHALFAKHWAWGSCQTKPLSSWRVSPAMQTAIKQMATCVMSARTKKQPGASSLEFMSTASTATLYPGTASPLEVCLGCLLWFARLYQGDGEEDMKGLPCVAESTSKNMTTAKPRTPARQPGVKTRWKGLTKTTH